MFFKRSSNVILPPLLVVPLSLGEEFEKDSIEVEEREKEAIVCGGGRNLLGGFPFVFTFLLPVVHAMPKASLTLDISSFMFGTKR